MNEAERILRDAGALLEDDHFVYVSGRHGPGWIDKDAAYAHGGDFVAANGDRPAGAPGP